MAEALEALELSFACPGCGNPVEGRLTPGTTDLTCPTCARETVLPERNELLASSPLAPCTVCGSHDLYHQRDFNRKIGLLIVAIGCVLGPWTHWISAVVAIVIDFLLFLVVPTMSICYACNAQYRGHPKERKAPEFDIAIHDAYKFGKRFPPRRQAAVAGPYQQREIREAHKTGREPRL